MAKELSEEEKAKLQTKQVIPIEVWIMRLFGFLLGFTAVACLLLAFIAIAFGLITFIIWCGGYIW